MAEALKVDLPVGERRRRKLVGALLALALVTGLVAIFAVWVNRQALNTDNWTTTSSEVLADPQVQLAVSNYLVNELFTSVDVAGELRSLLPPQAAALAGPGAAALRELATRAAPRLLASPAVEQAWRRANRAAHAELLRILNGGGPAVSTDKGEVVLNLRELINALAGSVGVQQQVAAARSKLSGKAGATVRTTAQQKLGVTLPPSSGRIVLLRSDQLSAAQSIAHAIRGLAVVLTAVSLALFVLAVALAPGWRRLALRRTGWCFIALGLFVLLARRVAGNRVVDDLVSSESIKPAVRATWTIGTSLLYDLAVAMVVYGVIIVLAAWLVGPTRPAVAVRRALAPSLRHRPALVYGTVALLFLLVLLWGPTPATTRLFGIAGLTILIVLGLEALRRQAAREFPDARRGETMDRVRARGDRVRGDLTRIASSASRLVTRTDAVARGPSDVPLGDLERLVALHDRGALTDDEFAAQKLLILNGS
jgi:hypothetical protein